MSKSWAAALKKLERAEGVKLPQGCECIGKYYDELTKDARDAWCMYYYGVSSKSYEEIENIIAESLGCALDLHFKCMKKRKMSIDEIKRYQDETRAEIENIVIEYNKERLEHE